MRFPHFVWLLCCQMYKYRQQRDDIWGVFGLKHHVELKQIPGCSCTVMLKDRQLSARTVKPKANKHNKFLECHENGTEAFGSRWPDPALGQSTDNDGGRLALNCYLRKNSQACQIPRESRGAITAAMQVLPWNSKVVCSLFRPASRSWRRNWKQSEPWESRYANVSPRMSRWAGLGAGLGSALLRSGPMCWCVSPRLWSPQNYLHLW